MSGSLAKHFHIKVSRLLNSLKIPADISLWPQAWKTVFFKEYPRARRITLPRPLPLLISLEKILQKRVSSRSFKRNKSITVEELSTVLYFAAGIKSLSGEDRNEEEQSSKRFYPSGGARYPLELYCAVRNVQGIEAGIYHYFVTDSALERIGGEYELNAFDQALTYPWSREAAVAILATAVWNRNTIKYADFGYKIIMLEAGHLVQNILLVSTGLGLKSCPLGGFLIDPISQILNINPFDEAPVHLSVIGH